MSIIALVDDWNKRRQVDLIASYDSEGLRASGKWARSLEGSTEQDGNTIKTVILGEQYTGALVGGRSATASGGGGSLSLRQVIRQWIDDKGITPHDGISKDSLAYLIARKIHWEGIRVPNQYNSGKFIDRVFDGVAINELSGIVRDSLAETMAVEVIKAVKK